MPSDIIGRALTKTFQNTNCNRVTNKANSRSRGHSCLRHCSKILSKLRLLAVEGVSKVQQHALLYSN